MRSLHIEIVAIALTMIATVSAVSPAAADDKSDIFALYKRLERAMKAQSEDQLLLLLAPTFKYETRDGKTIGAKEFAHQMKVQQAGVRAVTKMQMKVTKTVVTGKSAKVTNAFEWAMQIEDRTGQMGPKGQLHVMASTGVVENDLVKTNKGWLFNTLHTVNGNMTMDGQPIHRPGETPQDPQPESKPK